MCRTFHPRHLSKKRSKNKVFITSYSFLWCKPLQNLRNKKINEKKAKRRERKKKKKFFFSCTAADVVKYLPTQPARSRAENWVTRVG